MNFKKIADTSFKKSLTQTERPLLRFTKTANSYKNCVIIAQLINHFRPIQFPLPLTTPKINFLNTLCGPRGYLANNVLFLNHCYKDLRRTSYFYH